MPPFDHAPLWPRLLLVYRNSSYQSTIPESEEESDKSPDGGNIEEDIIEPAVISNEDATSGGEASTNSTQKAAKGGQRGNKTSKADQVSEMRGYSTLPRSRGQKSVPVSQTVSQIDGR